MTPAPPLPAQVGTILQSGSVTETAEQFIERKRLQWEKDRARASIRTKDIGRRGFNTWTREAWTFLRQESYIEKVLVIERLRRGPVIGERAYLGGAKDGDIEYRFGYYIVGRIGRAAGRWTWGQYSPLIPEPDLRTLLAKARSDGTIRPEATAEMERVAEVRAKSLIRDSPRPAAVP